MSIKINKSISKIYGKKYYSMLIVVFIITFVSALAQLFYTYEIGVVIDLKNYDMIVYNTILIIVAIIFRIITSFVKKLIFSSMQNNFLYKLRIKIVQKICYSNYKDIEQQDDKKLLSIMSTDIDGFKKWFETLFLMGELPVKLGFCLIYVLIMFKKMFSITDVVILLVVFIFTLTINNIMSKKIYKLNVVERENKSLIISHLVSCLNFRLIIKSYNLEDIFLKNHKIKISKYKNSEKKSYLYDIIINFYGVINGYFIFLFVLGIGAKNIINGTLQLGQMVSLLFLIDIVGQGISIIQSMPINYQKAKVSVKRVKEILDLHIDDFIIKSISKNKNNIYTDIKSNIIDKISTDKDYNNIYNFNNIWFSYDEKYVLKDINFQIKKGEKIAIVGKSGCGKSTLLKLICNLYSPNRGLIEFYGKDISHINKKHYYNQISVITQESFILDDTIKNNILIVKENLDDYINNKNKVDKIIKTNNTNEINEFNRISKINKINKDNNYNDNEIKKAIINSQLYEYISNLDNGIDTVIGDSEHRLSNGQNQRINIARAFYKDSDVYICDEPTSALDKENTDAIIDYFFKKLRDKTIIIICHNGIDLTKFDKVMFMINGTISGFNTHNNLLLNNKEYKKIIEQN